VIVWPEDAVEESNLGGKAARLFRMWRAGLPVPGAFAIPFDVPDTELATAIGPALDRLGAPSVAVRSSSWDEDTMCVSAAGVYRSHLNVMGPLRVLEAVRDVRESGAAPSAQRYVESMGLPGVVRMGVVVQRMLDAESAGVLFTRNPMDGSPQMVVESVWGLGVSLVSGEADPDRWYLGDGGRVEDRAIARKQSKLVARGREIASVRVAGTEQSAPSLTGESLRELWVLACRARTLFGLDLDIEWARAGGTIRVVQARPIPSAKPKKGIMTAGFDVR
jgi:pyruvate,water dikinase